MIRSEECALPNLGFDAKNVNRNSLPPLRNPQRDQSRHEEAPVLLAFQLRFIRLPKRRMLSPNSIKGATRGEDAPHHLFTANTARTIPSIGTYHQSPLSLFLSIRANDSSVPSVDEEKVSSEANGRRVSGCPDFCSASLTARAGVILPSHATGTRRRIFLPFSHVSGLVSCPARKMLCD
ncbi:hypothetical protein NPIL_32781 [Nephila pilipes]|uniref:Uncharacterized protein n=1 Tax=Nephila pilipes TaxID=299642 RepID=A0A8X6TCY8_NEPPI|nr:hypothetical protein NPIL_32781 [Nephila pilipes]